MHKSIEQQQRDYARLLNAEFKRLEINLRPGFKWGISAESKHLGKLFPIIRIFDAWVSEYYWAEDVARVTQSLEKITWEKFWPLIKEFEVKDP